MFTCYLQNPDLTLFVETKWAEWWDSFSHDGLRGKVVTCIVGLLSSVGTKAPLLFRMQI